VSPTARATTAQARRRDSRAVTAAVIKTRIAVTRQGNWRLTRTGVASQMGPAGPTVAAMHSTAPRMVQRACHVARTALERSNQPANVNPKLANTIQEKTALAPALDGPAANRVLDEGSNAGTAGPKHKSRFSREDD